MDPVATILDTPDWITTLQLLDDPSLARVLHHLDHHLLTDLDLTDSDPSADRLGDMIALRALIADQVETRYLAAHLPQS